MNLGIFIKLVTNIVFIYSGIKILRYNTEKRWYHPVTQFFYFILLCIPPVVDIINTILFCKHSPTLLMICFVYIGIVQVFFNRISFHDFWKKILFYFIYASSIILIEDMACYVASYFNHVAYVTYCDAKVGLNWHWSHLVILILAAVGALFFQRYIRERAILQYVKRIDIFFLICILTLQFVMEQYVFSFFWLSAKATSKYLIFIFLYIWMMVSLNIVFWIKKMLNQSENEQLLSTVQLNSLKKEYDLIMEQYTVKRTQLHDIIHQDLVIMSYMQNEQYTLAIQEFEKKIQFLKRGTGNKYTGIDAIDFIFDYEIEKAKKSSIKVKMKIDCFSCPMDKTEFCIIIGNLMDNAIEATEQVDISKRIIHVDILEPNDMFILKIRNPYSGEIKKSEGKYLTTKKKDLDMHSLGLRSVENLLKANNGMMEITDEGGIFQVIVFIYGSSKLGT